MPTAQEEIGLPVKESRGPRALAERLATITLCVLAMLQGFVLAISGGLVHRVIGLSVAVASGVVALAPRNGLRLAADLARKVLSFRVGASLTRRAGRRLRDLFGLAPPLRKAPLLGLIPVRDPQPSPALDGPAVVGSPAVASEVFARALRSGLRLAADLARKVLGLRLGASPLRHARRDLRVFLGLSPRLRKALPRGLKRLRDSPPSPGLERPAVVGSPDAGDKKTPPKSVPRPDQEPPKELTAARRLALLAWFGGVGFANFSAYAALAPPPVSWRVLQTAVLFGYASLCLAGAVWVIFRRAAVGLLASAITSALVLVAAEALLGTVQRGLSNHTAVRWVGGAVPHPVLEDYYPPNTTVTSIFSENPRGYFRASDPRSLRWTLGISHTGSAARLIFSDALGSDGARVEVDRAEVPTPWHIQLIYKGLKLEKDKAYVLAFNARADPPRTVSYVQAQSRPLWQTLGQFREIAVGADWREYLDGFEATGTSDDAEVSFNLGASTGAFEVKGVEVRSFATDASTVREPRAEYVVNYRFNDQGCRGPNYATAAPKRQRILVLGDSFALGVGVYEEDTFAAKLEALLNREGAKSSSGPTSEVINCSIIGHATREERRLFEILAPGYAPDIVIVAMTSDDDLSWRSAAQKGYVHQASRYEGLFLTWGLIQYAVHEGRRPPADFSDSLQELYRLRDLCARMNARLVVVAFRNAPLTERWQMLVRTISAGLGGSGVPWLDLGERLGTEHEWKDLVVWPGVDARPNEIAHLSAAQQIAQFLDARGLLR